MLELKHVKKSYDHVTILEDINLQIKDGEIVSILGPSGCGKTTLLNLVLGLTLADSGQILFDGKDITKVPMEERGFNIVFQDYALFPNLNVYKNVRLYECEGAADGSHEAHSRLHFAPDITLARFIYGILLEFLLTMANKPQVLCPDDKMVR